MGTETMMWLEPREVKNHLLLLTIGKDSPVYNYINNIDGELTEEKIAEINYRISNELDKARERVESLREAYDNIKRKSRNDFVYYYKYFTSRKGELDNLIKIKNYLQCLFDIKIDMNYFEDGFQGVIIKQIEDKIKIYLINKTCQDKKFILESYSGGSTIAEFFDESLRPIPYWSSSDDPTFLKISKNEIKDLEKYISTRINLTIERINQYNDFLKNATTAINTEDLLDLKSDIQDLEEEKTRLIETSNYFNLFSDIVDQIESKENDFNKLLLIQG